MTTSNYRKNLLGSLVKDLLLYEIVDGDDVIIKTSTAVEATWRLLQFSC